MIGENLEQKLMTTFNRDSFAEAKGSAFTLTDGTGQTVDLELSEVSPLKETPHQHHFAIVFLAPENYTVAQGLYDIQHPGLGAMQLFLVPVGIENGRMQLEAVFNLLRPKTQEG